jgi:FkbM family methyltransferase
MFSLIILIVVCSYGIHGLSYAEINNYLIYKQYLSSSYVRKKAQNKPLHILDVGAHDTKWAQTLQLVLSPYELEFFQIEGNSEHLSHLESFGHLFCLTLVGDVDGEIVEFHKSNYPEYTTGNSIFRERSNIYEHESVETRHMYRLDTVLSEAMFDEIFDLVKFDVQGSEKKALLGSENTLRKMDSGIIVIESALLPVNGGEAASLLDIQFVLESFGFSMIDVQAEHYLSTTTNFRLLQIDAVYRKQNYNYLSSSDGLQVEDEEEYSWPPVPERP